MPRFSSTTFITNNSYENFVRENTFLLKIKINKESKKWIIVNKYSEYPDEAEILLDRDCYFTVEEREILPIKMRNNTLRDIVVITLRHHDTLNILPNNQNQNGGGSNEIKIINMHDDILKSHIEKITNRSVNIVNMNTLLYDDTVYIPNKDNKTIEKINTSDYDTNDTKDEGGKAIEKINTLEYDAKKYHEIANLIYKNKKSLAYKTINKSEFTVYEPSESSPKKKEYITGGKYHHKYLKYKQKYLDLKKNVSYF